jgi:hypothetical protein
MEEGLEKSQAAHLEKCVRLKSVQCRMTHLQVGTMVESLLARRAYASSGIPLKNIPTDRALAGDAYSVGSMLEPIQGGT